MRDNPGISTEQINKKRRLTTKELVGPLGKLPPQAPDVEEVVLGALMIEKDALSEVVDILKPESFYKDQHQEIFAAIVELFHNTSPIDIITVTQELRKRGKLDFVGGPYYISKLTSRVHSAAHIAYHARIISEQSIKRELIKIGQEVENDAYEDSTDVFQLLDRTQQQIFEITEKHIRKNYEGMSDLIVKAIDDIKAKKDHKDGLTGVPSGFVALDRLTSGWQKSDLVIIAARPGMGKTAFVLSALRNAAVEFGQPVAIFSLEMSNLQLVNRLISSEAELESEKIKKGNLADYEWQQLVTKTENLSQAPIFIDDTPGLSILELRAKCRRLKSQHDIQLVVVDYLQLMTADNVKQNGGQGNREQEIAMISRSLKSLAKELNVPVIALSQLSRAVETRGGDKRPQLSDLRESGSIEQDADMVMFLYRPEYYGITQDEEGMPLNGTGEVIIAKHRNGRLENVQLKFIGKFTKFADLDDVGTADTYGNSFPTGGSNTDFTVTFQSKANENKSDEDMPF